MLRNSFVYSFALTASMASVAQEQTSDTRNEVIFPSKTYFMMAVDRHIAKNIKPVDMSRILGVPNISEADEQTIYRGVRKAILDDAASKWDNGMVSDYGREIERVMDWRDEDLSEGYELQNRIVLFRYALESQKASNVLDHYDRGLSAAANVNNTLAAVKSGQCDTLAIKSHVNFYEQLSELKPMAGSTLKLAKTFEALSSCQKSMVDTLLRSHDAGVTRDALLRTLGDAQQFSDPKRIAQLMSTKM